MVLALVVGLGTIAACGDGGKHPDRPKAAPPAKTLPTTYVPSVKRPNVMVIEADDMRWDELKFMPNVRKLIGGRGLRFTNSFAPYPLCCPSRASFLTGKYSHNHHVLSHVDPYGFQSFDDKVTLATVLQKAGYRTALFGKYLNGYARQHQYRSTEPSLHYVPPGWDQWYAGSDKVFPTNSRLHGSTYNYFAMTQNINGTVVPHPGVYSTRLLANQVQRVLTGFTQKEQKKPWFVWWTPVAPHMGGPKEADDPAPVLRDDGHLSRFATPARPAWVRGKFDSEITHGLGQPVYGGSEADVSDKPRFMKHLPELNPEEKVALTELTRQRAESLYVLDQQVGRVLANLKKLGQYDNTVVAFTSDNGYYLGEHRKRTGKIVGHEPSLRVPFLVAGPGIRHGLRSDPITSIDMAPTITAYAGVTMPGADGVSMVPVFEKGDKGWNRVVLTEGRMGEPSYLWHKASRGFTPNGLNARGVRTARWKYVRYSTGEAELYDLKDDPLELDSRQDDPAFAGVRKRLDRLWDEYYDCKGAACSKPMPAEFRATAAQTKAITDNQYRRTRSYYSDYRLR